MKYIIVVTPFQSIGEMYYGESKYQKYCFWMTKGFATEMPLDMAAKIQKRLIELYPAKEVLVKPLSEAA